MDQRIRKQKINKVMQELAWAYGIDDFHKKWPIIEHYTNELINSDYTTETIDEACRSIRKKSVRFLPTLPQLEEECDNLGAEGIGRPSISKLRTLHHDDMVRLYELIHHKNTQLRTNIPSNPLIVSNPDVYNEYLMDRKLANDPDFKSFNFIDTGKVVKELRIDS